MSNKIEPTVYRVNELKSHKVMLEKVHGQAFYNKHLLDDSKTGMTIDIVTYPAGYVTTWHTHPHAHGMYVISGRLKTSAGIVEAGDFVWFPEGCVMEHGAADNEDCTMLFMSNAPFKIDFVEAPESK